MSNWIIRDNRQGLEYNGRSHQYFWDRSYNANATQQNCLANCTTYAYGRILEAGQAPPVSVIRNANLWHLNLTNGWTAIPFNIANVSPGDLLEWSSNHVAVVEWVENGVAYYSQSSFTNRDTSMSLQQISDYMIAYYPNRFWSMNNTNNWRPTYILKNPVHYEGSEHGDYPGPGPGPDKDIPVWLLTTILHKKKRNKGGIRYL